MADVYHVNVVDAKIKEIALKIRKGSTSSLSTAKLFKVLDLLEGWSYEKTVGFIRVNDYLGDKPKRHMEANERDEFIAKKNIELNHAFRMGQAVDALPDNPEHGTTYVLDLTDVTSFDSHYKNKGYEFSCKEYRGERCVRITSSDGKTFDMFYRNLTARSPYLDYNFFGWSKETTLVTDICKLIDMPTPAEEKQQREHTQRDITNTGTCGICGRNVKLNKSSLYLVHHGYTRPGWGMIEGDCYGVHFDPHEVSPEACVEYRKVVQKTLVSTKKHLVKVVRSKRSPYSRAGGTEVRKSERRSRLPLMTDASSIPK